MKLLRFAIDLCDWGPDLWHGLTVNLRSTDQWHERGEILTSSETWFKMEVITMTALQVIASGVDMSLPRFSRTTWTHVEQLFRSVSLLSAYVSAQFQKYSNGPKFIQNLFCLSGRAPAACQKIHIKAAAWADSLGFPEAQARPKPWSSRHLGLA